MDLGVVYSAYLVYSPDDDAGASSETKAGEAIVNALVIVCFFLVATFAIVFCYKYNCTKVSMMLFFLPVLFLCSVVRANIEFFSFRFSWAT